MTRREWVECTAAAAVSFILALTLIAFFRGNKVRTGERQRAHVALDSTLASCQDSDIVFQTSTSNRGGVAWFSARCEVKP